MKITRSLPVHGTFSPAAVNVLGQIPANALFYVAHRLRHPDSIYSLSLVKVGEAFCKVAESYLSKMQEYRSGCTPSLEIGQVLRDQEQFLHALQEHLDELWLVLKTLADPSDVTKSQFADEYVLKNKLPGAKSFQEAITGYKRALRIANKLKHQQGYLRGIAIWLPEGAHLGYFLEEPDADGHLGPSPEIHPDRGAISFARDLTWHLFNVYLCSEKLAVAVDRALKARGLSLKPTVCARDEKWDKVIALAVKIPAAYFPKDVPKHAARFYHDASGLTLTVKFPERIQLRFPAQIQTTCSTVVDGHTPTFKVPFP